MEGDVAEEISSKLTPPTYLYQAVASDRVQFIKERNHKFHLCDLWDDTGKTEIASRMCSVVHKPNVDGFVAVSGVCWALPQQGYGAPPAPSASYGAPDLRAAASFINGQDDPIAALAANIPGGGVAGQDYPILASVPDTGFSCEDQQFPGYYADTADEAGCQVFHICQLDGRLDSFLCPNGTVFNQQYFVCDWWYNVDCSASEQYFDLNAEIGRVPEDSISAASDVALARSYGAPQTQAQAPSQSYNSPSRF
ncbi:uncharacterized protein [Panulirus ornatus]|uniref:uncharacterized protein n=1 Tax=Panulirus ornatus TaxID=150431 RepID=UPI003A883823